MATLLKLRLSALIAASSIVPAAIQVSALQASPQQTPSAPSQPTGKQPDTSPKPHQPRPNPDASGKYHVGDGVTAPKLIYSVEPEFSEKARKKKISGNCLVYLTVDTDGKVKDAHVLRSIADTVDKKNRAAALTLDDEAVKAALQYRFEPATFQRQARPS
jgi:TonB family protein